MGKPLSFKAHLNEAEAKIPVKKVKYKDDIPKLEKPRDYYTKEVVKSWTTSVNNKHTHDFGPYDSHTSRSHGHTHEVQWDGYGEDATVKVLFGGKDSHDHKPVPYEKMDEGTLEEVFKTKAKDGGTFHVKKRNTAGMRGSQDKFSMSHSKKDGSVTDWGSHSSVDGAKKFAKSKGIIEGLGILVDRVPLGRRKQTPAPKKPMKRTSNAKSDQVAHKSDIGVDEATGKTGINKLLKKDFFAKRLAKRTAAAAADKKKIAEERDRLDEKVNQAQVNQLEKFADRLLSKYKIDVEFTKHFVDRLNDSRNSPEIKVAELQKFFKKIQKNKGKGIKANPDTQVVLKDLASSINLPVVINFKNGEFEVVNKTVMRKKDFKTPNKTIKYEGVDPVNPSELKGKHKHRKDKDIDNDGDVDSSDQYLHRRRKVISKAMKKEAVGEEIGEESKSGTGYVLYHRDFSSAMKHAYLHAKKKHGITIKPKEIDDKVATGPRKPSTGKTNTYRLEGDKGTIQVQVYNKGGSKPYELNMYKEEVGLDEARDMSASPVSAKVVKDDGFRLVMKFKDGTIEALPPMELGSPSIQNLKGIVNKNILKNPRRKAWVPVVSAAMKRGPVKEEVGLDEAKSVEQQIADLEKYLRTHKGNTSSMRMRKVAIERKIAALQKRLTKEEVDLGEAVNWKDLPDDSWVLVQGRKVIKSFKKNPGNRAFSSSKDQELMTVAKAKKNMLEEVGLDDTEEVNEVLNTSQRIARGRQLRRNKAKLKLGRAKAGRRLASTEVLKKRTNRTIRREFEKKLLKGIPKSEQSPARKAEIEKRLNSPVFKNKMKTIAVRRFKDVRAKELERKRGGKNKKGKK